MISVLYVDDCLSLLDIVCRFLEEKGDVVVETSFTTEKASRIMDHISFDVIITDYNSKESSGIDLLQKTRNKGRMTPFIFFTLERDHGMEEDAARYGQVVFVPKLPYSGSGCDELEKTIRTIVPVPYLENTREQKDRINSMGGEPRS